jgi:hypothetical protein
MTPLQGLSYTNLFSHYRPTGDPEWYTKPNPIGTPEPVMDLDAEAGVTSNSCHMRMDPDAGQGLHSGEEGEGEDLDLPSTCLSPEEAEARRRAVAPYLSLNPEDVLKRDDDLFKYFERVAMQGDVLLTE